MCEDIPVDREGIIIPLLLSREQLDLIEEYLKTQTENTDEFIKKAVKSFIDTLTIEKLIAAIQAANYLNMNRLLSDAINRLVETKELSNAHIETLTKLPADIKNLIKQNLIEKKWYKFRSVLEKAYRRKKRLSSPANMLPYRFAGAWEIPFFFQWELKLYFLICQWGK